MRLPAGAGQTLLMSVDETTLTDASLLELRLGAL